MKFVVEIPDREIFEAAEKPEGLALEIAEIITNEIFEFSSVVVTPQKDCLERMSASPELLAI